MGRLAAIVNTAYVLAGVVLFLTGEAPVLTPDTDFLGNKLAMAWAGWKFCNCLYMALINFQVAPGLASAITMVPYVAFDVFAVVYTEHWTSLAVSFIALEALTGAAALAGYLKFGGVINTLYVLAGIALFATGESPVLTPGTAFLGDKLTVAWAGWKLSGCLYYALLNLGAHGGLATAVAMVPYVAFDVFAVLDTAHWTPLAYSFIALDGAIGVLGFKEWLEQPKAKGEGKTA